MTELSEAAQTILIAAPPRQGASVWTHARPEPAVYRELQDNGAITANHCLTRRGLILRERALDALLDAAF